jgi:serralysin
MAQIIGRLDSGASWADSTITYAMPLTAFGSGPERYGFKPMTSTMQAAAVDAFELWDDLIAPSLVRATSGADINFGYSSRTGGGTYAYTSYGDYANGRWQLDSAEIWLATGWWSHNDNSDFYFGSYGNLTYMHEIGHALGLDHPGNYNGSATYSADALYAQDTHRYTLMSYFDADADGSRTDHYARSGEWLFPQTPMVHDIAAIQAIYGRDMTTRSGNTTYGFGSNTGNDVFDFSVNKDPIVAIWDGGGTDWLSLSGFSGPQVIKLAAGSYSSVGGMTNNLGIAYGCTIENVRGGRGADSIYGNAADNDIRGLAGNDTIRGGSGDDSLFGGAGNDTIDGGAGTDTAYLAEARRDYRVADKGSYVLVTDRSSGEVDKYIGVEKLVFADMSIIL